MKYEIAKSKSFFSNNFDTINSLNTGYIVIDNILDDPYFFIESAKKIEFNLSHLTTIHNNVSPALEGINLKKDLLYANWVGYRSDCYSSIDYNIYLNTYNEIFNKLELKIKYFNGAMFLHFAPEFINEIKENWWHSDGPILAGVIYLNVNPKLNSGTLIRLDDRIVIVENIFNRLLLYRSELQHSPQGFFGTNINNARLTLTFFINSFNF